MNKEDLVINFLFPGDEIEFTLQYQVTIKRFIVLYPAIDEKSNDQIFILSNIDQKEFFEKGLLCDVSDYYLVINQGRLLFNNKLSNVSLPVSKMIIHRAKSLKNESSVKCRDYCMQVCSLRGKCKGEDPTCEYKDYSIPTSLLVGDEIEFDSISIRGRRSRKGMIVKLYKSSDNTSIGFCVSPLDNPGKSYINHVVNTIKVSKKNSIAITFNPCKLCILNSCSNCTMELFKNVDIIWKKY